jgi:hypothetical protein
MAAAGTHTTRTAGTVALPCKSAVCLLTGLNPSPACLAPVASACRSPRTLRDVLDSRELDEERRWSILRQLLAGLAHIHSQGIIHRDLKVCLSASLWGLHLQASMTDLPVEQAELSCIAVSRAKARLCSFASRRQLPLPLLPCYE